MDKNSEGKQKAPVREQLVLHGKRLKICWYLLKNPGSHSARSIQRKLGLSSPSLALHHLRKLQEMELVDENDTGFYFVQQAKAEVLQACLQRRRFYLPHQLFEATFFTLLLLYYILLFPKQLDAGNLLILILLIFGTATAWFEVWSTRRTEPF